MGELRRLGSTGLTVAPLALGTNVFGWTVDEKGAFEILDAFVDAGFNLVDTADVYETRNSGTIRGQSETIIGRWLRESGRREDVLLATKVGMPSAARAGGLARPYILESVDRSLARLETDRIDLYQAHADDPSTPLEETLAAFDSLVRSGKVRAVGASNYSAERLRESCARAREAGVSSFGSLQPLYNLFDREVYERDLAGAVAELGLGVLPYAALASGFLTGKYRSSADLAKSVRRPMVEPRLTARGLRILAAMDDVAAREGLAHASVAIAWLRTRPTITAPIASATSRAQLDDLIRGARASLARSSVEQLDRASAESADPAGPGLEER